MAKIKSLKITELSQVRWHRTRQAIVEEPKNFELAESAELGWYGIRQIVSSEIKILQTNQVFPIQMVLYR